MAALVGVADAALERLLPLGAPAPAAARPIPLRAAEVPALLGTYANERVITLLARRGRLYLREEPSAVAAVCNRAVGAEVPVTRIGPWRFAFTGRGGEADTFELIAGADGRVRYLHTGSRALARRTLR